MILLDPINRVLTADGAVVPLTEQETNFLHKIATSGDDIILFADMYATLWPVFKQSKRSRLSSLLHTLNKKFEQVALAPLERVTKKGYVRPEPIEIVVSLSATRSVVDLFRALLNSHPH